MRSDPFFRRLAADDGSNACGSMVRGATGVRPTGFSSAWRRCRRDVVVATEQVVRVVERLHPLEALPGVGVEEGARVRRLLDEVRVVAGAVRRDGGEHARRAPRRPPARRPRSGTTPRPSTQISPGSVARAPAPGAGGARAPPDVAELQQRQRRAGAGDLGELLDGARRQVVDEGVRGAGRAAGRAGPSPGRRGRSAAASANVSSTGPSRRSGRSSSRPSASPSRGTPPCTITNARPRNGSGTSGSGGKWMTLAHDVSSSGSAGRSPFQACRARRRSARRGRTARRRRARAPAAPSNSMRGHDAEVAAAAAQGPEQLGLVLGVGADEAALGGDELDRGHGVRLHAVLAGEPADAAAERVADDADVRRGAVQRGQPELGQPRRHLAPSASRRPTRTRRAAASMETPVSAEVLSDQGALERPERAGVVPGRLGRDAEAALGGVRRRTAATSSSFAGNAIASGCWSISRLKVPRAASQSASPGRTTRPSAGGRRSTSVEQSKDP